MKKTKTWKARRLEIKRRKRLRVQRETRRLLAKHPQRLLRRHALADQRKDKRAARRSRRTRREQQAAKVAAWVAEGRCKPTGTATEPATGSSRLGLSAKAVMVDTRHRG